MRKRSRHISVWLTDQEHDHLKRQAALSGLGIDPFLRNLIHEIDLRPRPPDAYPALLHELSAIGNNINQIARIANGKKSISPAEVDEAVRLTRQAWNLVKEAF